MATLRSDQGQTNSPAKLGTGPVVTEFSFTAAVALATGDIIILAQIPATGKLVDFYVESSISPGTTVPLSLGDAALSTRWWSALATGGATFKLTPFLNILSATVASAAAATTLPLTYATASDFRITLGTVTAGGTPTIRGWIMVTPP